MITVGRGFTIQLANDFGRQVVVSVYETEEKTWLTIAVYDLVALPYGNWQHLLVHEKALEGDFKFGRAEITKAGGFRIYDSDGNLLEVIQP